MIKINTLVSDQELYLQMPPTTFAIGVFEL